MPLSPQIQNMMQPPSTEDAQAAFEQGFGQMAQSALAGKFPELIDSVVTFKVIQSDIDEGSGVGAFIADLGGQTVHIPVVLSGNQIKPLELLYVPDRDTFLPLDKNWLDEVARGTLDVLGQGVEAPRTLEPDQDIRNLVVPPTTGRYAYASADPPGKMPGDRLCTFLDNAPNFVKRAFAQVLENSETVLKFAFENFDQKRLLAAITPHAEKVAADEGSVTFLTPDASAADFRAVFGEKCAAAWGLAAKYGFVVRDTRARANMPIEVQNRVVRTTANESGFYRLYFNDGTTKLCLVLANPFTLKSTLLAGVRGDIQRYPDQYRKRVKKQVAKRVQGANEGDEYIAAVPRFIILTEDGKLIDSDKRPVGELIHPSVLVGKDTPFKSLLDRDAAEPAVGNGSGIFVRYKGGRIQGTEIVEALSVVTDSQGVRRIKTYGNTIVTDPNSPVNTVVSPTDGNITYVPPSFMFLKGDKDYDTTQRLMTGADDTLAYLQELQKTGALHVRIKDDGGLFSIGGTPGLDKVAAMRVLIDELELRAVDAMRLMKHASDNGTCSFYLVNPEQLHQFAAWVKRAAEEAPKKKDEDTESDAAPESEGAPEGTPEGVPPEMAAVPPEMMAPPEPPPPPLPNPVEMAAVEVSADLARQTAAVAQQLAEQHRDLSNQLSAIETVKQRAMQIAAEQQGAAPPGAPAEVPQQPMPGAPSPEGTPEGMPQEMPPEGAPPGALPMEVPEISEMPAAGMGMDFGPAGAPPGAGPADMMGAPGAQGAPDAAPSPEELAAQAGPQMEEAAKLRDPEAFAATAIGSMATDANLSESVADYVPDLESAVDSLGRMLMTLWIKEEELRPDLGEQDYTDLEKRLRTVFNNLGGLVLKVNQTALTSRDKEQGEEA